MPNHTFTQSSLFFGVLAMSLVYFGLVAVSYTSARAGRFFLTHQDRLTFVLVGFSLLYLASVGLSI